MQCQRLKLAQGKLAVQGGIPGFELEDPLVVESMHHLALHKPVSAQWICWKAATNIRRALQSPQGVYLAVELAKESTSHLVHSPVSPHQGHTLDCIVA